MFIGSGENQERFLFKCSLNLVRASAFQIIDFTLSKDKGFSFDSSLLESDSSSHILNMLDDEVNRDPIISETRDDDVSVHNRREDKVPKGIFNEFVVLLKHTDDRAASFYSVSFEPTTETDIICFSLLLPSQFMKIL